MRSSMICGLALMLLMSLCSSAQAELWVEDSLEWMVEDSDLIVVGSVVHERALKKPNGSFVTRRVQIRQVLKGQLDSKEITIRSWSLKNRSDNLVFFLKRGHNVYPAKDYRRASVRDHWTQRTYLNGNQNGVIDLKKIGDGIATAAFDVLKQPKEILSAIKQLVRGKRFTSKRYPRANTSFGKSLTHKAGLINAGGDVYASFYAGSAVWLVVPKRYIKPSGLPRNTKAQPAQ